MRVLRPWLAASFFGAAAVLLLLPLLIPSPLIRPVPSDGALQVQDRHVTASQVRAESAARTGLAPSCSSGAASGLIKHELFRRAARLRGSDSAAFLTVANHSVVRLESPILRGGNQESGTISCKASVAVDLPPGVMVPGERRTLATDIAYSLRAADGVIEMVSLSDEGPIVTPLARLARMPRQATDQLDPLDAPEKGVRNEPARVVEQMLSAAQRPEAAVAPAQARQAPAWQRPIKPAWQRPLPPPRE